MEGTSSQQSRQRLLVYLVVGLLLAGIAWHQLHRAAQRSSLSTDLPSIPVAHPTTASALAPAAPQMITGDKASSSGKRKTTICGIGTVEVDQGNPAAPYNYVNRLTATIQSRWRQSLLDNDDARLRAAGLLIASEAWDFDPVTHMPTRTQRAAMARDELVQLAAGLTDLQIYVMAVRACDPSNDGGTRGAACDRISLAEWANRDPDNIAPWLQIASEAHARSDRAAELEAAARAASAHTVNFYTDSELPYVVAATPPDGTDLARAAFADPLIGHVGGDGFAHAYATSTYCTDNAIKDSTVRGHCESLAELLANNARSTLDIAAAVRIGRRLGWSNDRTTALEQEMLAAFRVETRSGDDPWSCDNVRAVNSFTDIQARGGELAAARAAIQQTGKSIAELAQEQVDRVKPGIYFNAPQ